MRRFIYLQLLLFFISFPSISQESYVDKSFSTNPKYEMRGLYISTHFRLDWPSSNKLLPDEQKTELITILDKAKSNNYNAIFFQVRATGDAYYKSDLVPWSRYLNPLQKEGENPGWDPLAFIVEESHKRGLELHAWLNPYRIKVGNYDCANNHIAKTHPEWMYQMNHSMPSYWLNPGLEKVKNHIKEVVKEIVSNYDVDGIHFDDYFYPKGINKQDEITYNSYAENSCDLLTIADWRRKNTTDMVSMVYDAIQIHNSENKKNVIFGVSPFGIYRHNVPQSIGSVTQDCYDDQYYDPIKWLLLGKVDYLSPQLYWPIKGEKKVSKVDFETMLKWWDEQSKIYNKPLYVALAGYRLATSNWKITQIQNQIDNCRKLSESGATSGTIMFRAETVVGNQISYKNINQELKSNQFASKCLSRTFLNPNKPIVATYAPQNVRIEKGVLYWDKPSSISDKNLVSKYVVYAFNSENEALAANEENGSKIVEITGSNQYEFSTSDSNKYFVVSSIDKDKNEYGDFNCPISYISPPNSTDKINPKNFLIFDVNNLSNDFPSNISDQKNLVSPCLFKAPKENNTKE